MRKLTLLLFGLCLALDVSAASHRTFVAATGSDSGTCGPTTPCRSLEYALGQTNSGGEIVITQSGGYGNATGGLVINKSISIIAEPGVFAALAPISSAGITIATTGIDVAIKNLTINGRGGSKGIDMTNGAGLDLDNVTITNFPSGHGLHIQTPARVTVSNSTFRGMYYGAMAGYQANLLVKHTRLTDIGGYGVTIFGGTSGTTFITAENTVVRCQPAGSGYAFDNHLEQGATGKMFLNRVVATNCYYGVVNTPYTTGAAQVIAISNSFVTGNYYGLINSSANNTFLSSGNNHVSNNTFGDTSGSITTGTIFK